MLSRGVGGGELELQPPAAPSEASTGRHNVPENAGDSFRLSKGIIIPPMSSRGGFSAARAAMMRCAHGRLAQRLRAGRAVVAMGVGRKVCGERRMTAAAVLQRAAPAAAGCDRPHYANLAPEGLRMASSASRCSGEKVRQSICKVACLRARSERILCEMGPPNPVLYVGTETPGRPGFS